MKAFIILFLLTLSYVANSQERIKEQKSNETINRLKTREEKRDSSKSMMLLQFVNPFIGTDGHGHTYPGASAPFGMMQLSPDTRLDGWDACSGYHYSDTVIFGFSHTHLSGTGVEDYCDILFTPYLADEKEIHKIVKIDHRDRKGHSFSHVNEKAEPGYYSVNLDNGIGTEFTVSTRAGIHRYDFPPSNKTKFLLIDLTYRDELLKSNINIHSNSEFSGFRVSSAWAKEQHVYFHFNTSIPTKNATVIDQGKILLLEFENDTDIVEIKIGISSVSEQSAKNNLVKEIGTKTFKEVKKKVQQDWAYELSQIQIHGVEKDKELATIFYTALYHSYLAPNTFSDSNGEYRIKDPKQLEGGEKETQYTVFSLWDTYRATHPWYTIFQQERTKDFIKSFERHYKVHGTLPVWELAGNETNCMIGFHAVSVIADAYLKGYTKIDVPLLIDAIEKTAFDDNFGKVLFSENGYINYKQEPESVSKNLEYAYDSYCAYLFLKEAQKKGYTVDENLVQKFYKNAFNFINSFDPQTGFMRARNGGIWKSNFSPEEVNFHYTEANSWQYSLYAPHAIPILSKLIGGENGLEKWLDKLFTTTEKLKGNNQLDITGLIGQYAHGNEPSHHMAYLYNYTNAPEKTAFYLDSILFHQYKNTPAGLSGNEDCGQMSSWYTFSALGLYPVSPGSLIYDFGRPIFDNVVIQTEGGKRVRIVTINNSRKNKYIQGIRIDNEPYKKRYITHEDLLKARIIEFTMGPFPSAEYRTYEIAPSLAEVSPDFVSLPYFTATETIIDKTATIEIKNVNNNLVHFYTLDGSVPTKDSKKYKKPFKIKQNTVISIIAFNPKTEKYSAVISNEFHLKRTDVSLQLTTPYRPQYSASGDDALIDQLYGGSEYRSGEWQGFYNVDANGIVTFQQAKLLEKVGISALQSTRSWIFPPKEVQFKVTFEDNTTETFSQKLMTHPNSQEGPEQAILYEQELPSKKVKSIEFTAFNYGPNPGWHKSPGFNTFIFLDEIYFK